jgi:hypothetical protein
VLNAVPLADQLGARHRASRVGHHLTWFARSHLRRESIQRPPDVPANAAKGQFLDAVPKPHLKVLAACIRRGRIKDRRPFLAQLRHGHRLQRDQVRQDSVVLRSAKACSLSC